MSRAAPLDLNRANCAEIRQSESRYNYPIRISNYDENDNFISHVDWTDCTGTAPIFDRDKVTIGTLTVSFRAGGWVDLSHSSPSALPLTRQATYQLLITHANGDRICWAEGDVEVIP